MTRKGITVTSVEGESFRRLRFARAELVPGKGLVRVTGKNGSGKTTFLRMIREALGGAGEVLPESVHEGSEDGTGEIRLTLSNGFSVRRRYTESNPKGYLTVEGPDGGKHGQAKLTEWVGPLSFDVLTLFGLPPERQRDVLLASGADPELPGKLDALRQKRRELYDERTPWISQQRRARQVPKPDGDRPEPIDVSAELKRMGELQKAERERGDAAREVRTTRDQIGSVEGRIEALTEQIAKLMEERDRLADRKKRMASYLKECEEALAGLPDPSGEMEEVRERIDQADRIHAALRPWEQWDQAQEELDEAEMERYRLTAEMEALAEKEAELIREAGIPVEGIGFADDGDPLLHGRPLEVASGAEKIQMAVAVAMAANPDLRICLLDEANDIDLEGLEELDRLAKEHDFQIFAARLGLEGPGEIVIEDGVALDRDADPAEAAD